MKYCDLSVIDSRVLIIDDDDQNVLLVERILDLAGLRNVKSVSDSRLALETIRDFKPDVVLLDLHMHFFDGFKILADIRELEDGNGYMPVLVFTADSGEAAKNRALSLGASDFLIKPGNPSEILQRVKNFLRARKMHVALQDQNNLLDLRVKERTAELEEARMEILDKLARAGEFRDDETGEHTERVGLLAGKIAAEMGHEFKECELICFAAQLHDIGKIGIPDSVLLKPGKLTAEEFEVMKRHTEFGASILKASKAPLLKMAREIALFHHENWNGSGYPNGLRGEEIPLCARIVSVADVYDALTHARPYKMAWSEDQAIDEILRLSGTKFDPTVVEAFMALRSAGSSDSLAA